MISFYYLIICYLLLLVIIFYYTHLASSFEFIFYSFSNFSSVLWLGLLLVEALSVKPSVYQLALLDLSLDFSSDFFLTFFLDLSMLNHLEDHQVRCQVFLMASHSVLYLGQYLVPRLGKHLVDNSVLCLAVNQVPHRKPLTDYASFAGCQL